MTSTYNNTYNDDENPVSTNVDFLFLAKIDNTSILSTILNTLNFGKKTEMVNVTLGAKGMKFTVDNSRCFQVNTFLQSELFQEYNYRSDDKESFSIQLSALLDCLNIYGVHSQTALQIAYQSYGRPLLLMLEENEVLTDCGIRPNDSLSLTKYDIKAYPIVAKIIMKSESLCDAFNELDWSSDFLTWEISDEAPHFRLKAQGSGTLCQVDYPSDCEVFETFECMKASANEYKMKLLQPCLSALKLAKKTQIRINEQGLLSLQHMIATEDSQHYVFVDFFICSMEGDDESSG